MRRTVSLLPALTLAVLGGCTAELKLENTELQRTLEVQEAELAQVVAQNERLRLEVADLEAKIARRELADSLGLDPGQRIWALLETSLGEVVCELLPKSAPKTVANFVGLAEGTKPFTDPQTGAQVVDVPFYDGTIFHRVLPDFMIQGGDRAGTGKGSAGFTIDDEIDPELTHAPGTLSMANTGAPNTGSAQFFITEVASPHLDGKHSAFGQCGPLTIISEIAAVERDERNRPLDPVTLERVTVHRGKPPLR